MQPQFILNQPPKQLISNEIRSAEHEYMNKHPPINALQRVLQKDKIFPNMYKTSVFAYHLKHSELQLI